MRTSALTRVRRRNSEELLAAAGALAAEAVRTAFRRGPSKRAHDRLRRALCTIAERLATSDAELDPLLAHMRCGHRRGRWTRELTPRQGPGPRRPADTGLADLEDRRVPAQQLTEGPR